ncbi:MAG: hypothetical protein DRP08_04375, partial [Candidatus Aenigmatarchaeota archaeon]
MDSLDARGIPIYKVVDPIENAGIPSLPLFVGVFIILIAIVAYLLTAGSAAGTPIYAMDTTALPVAGATVTVTWDGGEAIGETDADGYLELDIAQGPEITITAEKEGCETTATTYESAPEDITIEMNCQLSPEFAGCLQISEDMESTYL